MGVPRSPDDGRAVRGQPGRRSRRSARPPTREPGRPRILTVGRLVERKGFQDVIRAMRAGAGRRVRGGRRAAGRAAGRPTRRPGGCGRWPTSCGVADRVRLVGAVPREEMARWYRSADVLVAAPWYEPFGLTPLEAMACGVPVVGTAVGGLIDTVVDGADRRPGAAPGPARRSARPSTGCSATGSAGSPTPRRRWTGPGSRYSWHGHGGAARRGLRRGGDACAEPSRVVA